MLLDFSWGCHTRIRLTSVLSVAVADKNCENLAWNNERSIRPATLHSASYKLILVVSQASNFLIVF